MDTPSMKSGLVLGGLLIVLGVLALVETVTDLNVRIWVAVLVIGGLIGYGVYATDREEKWLLIISYAMLAVAGLVTFRLKFAFRDFLDGPGRCQGTSRAPPTIQPPGSPACFRFDFRVAG